MNVFLNTYAYIRDIKQITSSENVFSFLEKVAAFGYRIQQGQSQDYWRWRSLAFSSDITSLTEVDSQSVQLFTMGIAPTARESLSTFLQKVQSRDQTNNEEDFIEDRYEFDACAIDLLGMFRGMNFTITLDTVKNVIILTIDERLLDAVDSPERRNRWRDLARLVYQHFHLLFELPLNEDYGRFEQRDEIEGGNVQWLRWFNFYSPELVAHFGRERLFATPDAGIEELDDGGILLIPRDFKAVEVYLNLRSPFVSLH